MHPRDHIGRTDDRPALVMAGSGQAIGYAELDARANRVAHFLRARGLMPGDRVAIWLENHVLWSELCWGAHNAGLLYVPVSTRLTVDEAAYIARDCGAKLVLVSPALAHAGLARVCDAQVLVLDRDFERAVSCLSAMPLPDEVRGAAMVYSSGTTGRPKGITPRLDPAPVDEPTGLTRAIVAQYGFDRATTFLSTAPMYHTAPLKFTMMVQQAGGTVVVMEKFDPAAALDALERYRVTHSQWVPTMFVRLLRLGDRRRFDHHRVAIHSAAPCPVPVKQAMMDWWGPVLHEYYGGSESVGQTAIGPEEWLRRPGSVGRPIRGVLHILGDDDRECGPGETGLVCFEGCADFTYHNDPEKTARAKVRPGWGTLGDIGHVDAEGYLFLTDRRDYVINSGGVNIYPQEAENVLSAHPAVADVAVFGVPDPEWGEAVKAVVQPATGAAPGPELADALIAWCRAHIAHTKCPRSVDFEPEMPREPTGKLLKRVLKARYWPVLGDKP
jgi:long-chain acyl-CoA synthetase